MFFCKNHTENQAGRLVHCFALFFKRVLYEVKKELFCGLVSVLFGSRGLRHIIKTNCI